MMTKEELYESTKKNVELSLNFYSTKFQYSSDRRFYIGISNKGKVGRTSPNNRNGAPIEINDDSINYLSYIVAIQSGGTNHQRIYDEAERLLNEYQTSGQLIMNEIILSNDINENTDLCLYLGVSIL